MRKKNGFISISVVYSFFVTFLLLLVVGIRSYANNRASFDIYKDYLKDNIQAKNYNSSGNSRKLTDEISSLVSTYGKTSWATRNWYLEKVGNDYYYRGSTPQNFVCLSPDVRDTCKSDYKHLYRIVGLFSSSTHKATDINYKDKAMIKIVKYTPYMTSNHTGALQALAEFTDNAEYFSDKARKLLAEVNWTTYKAGSASAAFSAFRTNEINNANLLAFAGMLTVSDIGYTTGDFTGTNCHPNSLMADNLTGLSGGTHTGCASYGWNISEQWLYNESNNTAQAFHVNSSGSIAIDNKTTSRFVRPVLYLKPDAVILKGSGSQDDPYVLNIDPKEEIGDSSWSE